MDDKEFKKFIDDLGEYFFQIEDNLNKLTRKLELENNEKK